MLSSEYKAGETVVESHRGEGVCSRCGAALATTAECPHSSMEDCTTTGFRRFNIQYVDQNTHSYMLEKSVSAFKVCNDCGYIEYESVQYDDPVLMTEAHQADSNGWCSMCGRFAASGNTCDHEGFVVERKTTRVAPNMLTGEVDESGHYAVCTDVTTAYCTYCGIMLGAETGAEHVECVPHTYDENGVCTACGYRSTCKHANKVSSETEEAYLVNYVGEKTHKTLYIQIENDSCPDCGWESSETIGFKWVEDQPHCILNGICTECSYVTPCTHPNAAADPAYSSEEIEYEIIDQEYHNEILISRKSGVCPDCEAVVVLERTTSLSGAKAHDYAADGKCACGAVNPGSCAHPDEDVVEAEVSGARETRYIPVEGDDSVHVATVYAQYQKHCSKCGASIGEPSAPEPVRTLMPRTVAHTFENGVCRFCGFGQPCDHQNASVEVSTPELDHYEATATEHTAVYAIVKTISCPDCGYRGSETTYSNGNPEAHAFEAGVCVICRYECQHPEELRTSGETDVQTSFVADNDSTHHTETVTRTKYTCICGAEDWTSDTVTGDSGAHDYICHLATMEYVCRACGHVCSHSNAEREVSEKTLDHYNCDLFGHIAYYTWTEITACPDCSLYETYNGTEAGASGEHEWDESVCTVCSFVCPHSLPNDKKLVHEVLGCEAIDDESHREVGNEFFETSCIVCGVVTNKTDPVEWKSEPMEHHYADGVCYECGHSCSHVGHEVSEDVFVARSCASISATEHAVTGDVYRVTGCDLCGEKVSEAVVEENAVVNGKHVFSGRKCTLCGYTKPVEANETPSVVDEQIFNEVSADEKVHGVAVSEHLRMAVALVRALRGITEEYGEDVQIRIIDIELILTDAEIEALNALIPEERILVFLNVLGYVNEVNIANEELEIKLSDEAQALLDGIAARLEAMTEEERAEFDATVQTVYPVLQVEVDGTVADQTEIVIELKLREKNAYRVERYTFRCEDGSWYFAALAN